MKEKNEHKTNKTEMRKKEKKKRKEGENKQLTQAARFAIHINIYVCSRARRGSLVVQVARGI